MSNNISARVQAALEVLDAQPNLPYYRDIHKNLSDGLTVYLNALTNLDTILEDSIKKLNSPPPEPKRAKWPPSWS